MREVLNRPFEDRAGAEGARVAVGRTAAGRYLRVIYVPDPEPDSVFVITVRTGAKGNTGAAAAPQEDAMTRKPKFPAGWEEARVRRVLEHYEDQTDEEAVAEDEATLEAATHTLMDIPVELLPAVRKLIGSRRSA